MYNIFLADNAATEGLGAKLQTLLPASCLVFLHGDLGMGKTSVVRGFLRALGYTGAVKSPTYNLVEEYHLASTQVLHFDLYRVVDPEELEWIGMRDYLGQTSQCFIEWPEQGGDMLPAPDVDICLSLHQGGRMATITAGNSQLAAALQGLNALAVH